jgi:hypothetical protein
MWCKLFTTAIPTPISFFTYFHFCILIHILIHIISYITLSLHLSVFLALHIPPSDAVIVYFDAAIKQWNKILFLQFHEFLLITIGWLVIFFTTHACTHYVYTQFYKQNHKLKQMLKIYGYLLNNNDIIRM